MKTTFNKTIKQSFLLLAVILLIPSLLLAGGHGRRNHDGQQGFQEKFKSHPKIWQNQQLIEEIGLDAKQIELLKNLDFDQKEKRLKIKSEMDALHLSMEKAFSQNSLNQDEIMEIAKKIADLQGKQFIERIESHLKFLDVLTTEQITKLKSVQKMFRGGDKRGRKGGYGDHSRPFKR